MRHGALLLALASAGCHHGASAPQADTPGARIERAAMAAGLVADPARTSLAGSWARDTDRLCIVPAGDDGGGNRDRIGAAVDFGDGQSCSARGDLVRHGTSLDVRLGEGCAITATFDGDRIVFPPELPAGCETLCSGRASLAALMVERLGASVSEARMVRDPHGALLCGS